MDINKLKDIFKDGWDCGLPNSYCGSGSVGVYKSIFDGCLRDMIGTFDIKSIADAGCGDLYFISNVIPLVDRYIGYDLVEWDSWSKRPNVETHANFNICESVVERSDLIISISVGIHLPNDMIIESIKRFKESGSKYFYTNSCLRSHETGELILRNDRLKQEPNKIGDYYNLELPPFNLPNPVVRNNGCCLWRLDDIEF